MSRRNVSSTLGSCSWALACALVPLLGSGTAFARAPAAATPTDTAAATKSGAQSTASSGETGMANAGAASVPPITPVEKKAARLSNEALGADFSAERYKVGEKKLHEAIRICNKPEACSTSFQARLHRDLGFIYVTAMDRVDDGKDEFAIALNLDPSVILPFLQQTGAATKAFADVKARLARGEVLPRPPPPPPPVVTPKPEPAPKAAKAPKAKAASKAKPAEKAAPGEVAPEDIVLEEEPEPKAKVERQPKAETADPDKSADFTAAETASESSVVNWLTLTLRQDLVIHSATSNVCSAGSRYECFAQGERTELTTNEFTSGGNRISGTTVSQGSLRILLGYERVVYPDVSVGARVGSVLYGASQRTSSDPRFLYFMAKKGYVVDGSRSVQKAGSATIPFNFGRRWRGRWKNNRALRRAR